MKRFLFLFMFFSCYGIAHASVVYKIEKYIPLDETTVLNPFDDFKTIVGRYTGHQPDMWDCIDKDNAFDITKTTTKSGTYSCSTCNVKDRSYHIYSYSLNPKISGTHHVFISFVTWEHKNNAQYITAVNMEYILYVGSGDYTDESTGFVYHFSENITASLIDGKSATGNTVIPETIAIGSRNFRVTSIADNAISYCTGLASISIPNSVTSIGGAAFRGCTSLTSVNIPNSVINIGPCAFENCTGLTSINIPNSVTEIGDGAFIGCTGLTSITIPNSVTSIGYSAFSDCSGLKSVSFHCKEIKSWFSENANIKEVIIGEEVVTIGHYAFGNCTGLTSVVISNGVTNIGDDAFSSCTGLKSTTLPNSVTSIGSNAFWNCTNLTSINIPNSVKTIGNYAFERCNSLESVSFHCAEIGSWFNGNTNIKEVIIGNEVTSIGEYAFSGCTGIMSLTIPNSVTNIGQDAFNNCSGLESVTFHCAEIEGWIYGNDNIKEVVIGDEVTSIAEDAFSGFTGIKSIIIPNSITTIGKYAFNRCTGLETIILHCKEIGSWWFGSNDNIKEVIVGDEVNIIGDCAFYGFDGLTSMAIPNSVNSIGRAAFAECTNLTSIKIPNSVINIGDEAFEQCTSLSSVTMDNGIVSIGGSAFTGCTSLTSINIPNSVTSLGRTAFSSCTSLASITLSNKIVSIEERTFINCKSLTSVNIPSSVTSIGERAFMSCESLISIMLPDCITSIDYMAFSGCSNLADVTVRVTDFSSFCNNSVVGLLNRNIRLVNQEDEEITEYIIPDDVTSIGDKAFYNCTGLTTVNIGKNVTSIGEKSFAYCLNLNSVTIPNSLTSIGEYAFLKCIGLTSIDLPNCLISIGDNAFRNCLNLTSVTIPNSVKSIGARAFLGTLELESVISCIEEPFEIAEDVFDANSYESAILYVPTNCTNLYRNVNSWSQFTNIEELEPKTIDSGDFTDPETSIVYHCDGETLTAYVKDGTQASGDAVIRDMVTFKLNEYVVNRIDDNAFKGCIGITSVTIPSSVETIGESAFDECTNLTTVFVEKNTPIAITSNVFANRTNMTLYVPTGYIEAYKQADYWKEFMAIYDFLLYEAQTLVADTEAVAIGKLQDAIDAYKEKSDTDALQSAIEVFKDENADVEKDETAKVSIEPARWEGATGWCATQYAPAITTYDGRIAQMVENYNGNSGSVTGKIFYQTITGLTNGMYKIGFYANAFTTADRDKQVETGMADGAQDVAYVYANDTKQFVVAHRATSTIENGLYNFDVEVTDGNIEIGLAKEKEGTNWHTLQIYRLTWFASAKEVYAADKVVMQEAIDEAKGLKNEYRTEGIDAINDAIASAEAALVNNRLNIPEFEAEIDKLRTAMENFRKINSYIYEGLAYVKDIETGLYMAAGSTYSTRGMVNKHGIDLTFTANGDDGTVLIDSRVEYQGVSNLGINLYMDSNPYGWVLERETDGYHIRTAEGQYISVDNDNNLVLSSLPRLWMIVSKEDYLAEKMNMMAEATEENPIDATWLINAPNFNRNDARNNLWTVSDDCTSIHYKLGDGILDNYCATISYSTFTVSQTIENAPAGIYRMTAQGFYAQAGDITEEAPEFFIGDSSAKVPQQTGGEEDPFDASEAFSNGLYFIEPIEYKHYGDKDLLLGIKGTAENQWTTFDNFQLTYYGPFDVPTKIEEDKVTKQNDPIYNLNGQKVNRNYKGLIIKDRKKVFTK